MVNDIMQEIQEALIDHIGGEPTRVYLGRIQIDKLTNWAIENKYIIDALPSSGSYRLKVKGLMVYKVDDDNHCVVA